MGPISQNPYQQTSDTTQTMEVKTSKNSYFKGFTKPLNKWIKIIKKSFDNDPIPQQNSRWLPPLPPEIVYGGIAAAVAISYLTYRTFQKAADPTPNTIQNIIQADVITGNVKKIEPEAAIGIGINAFTLLIVALGVLTVVCLARSVDPLTTLFSPIKYPPRRSTGNFEGKNDETFSGSEDGSSFISTSTNSTSETEEASSDHTDNSANVKDIERKNLKNSQNPSQNNDSHYGSKGNFESFTGSVSLTSTSNDMENEAERQKTANHSVSRPGSLNSSPFNPAVKQSTVREGTGHNALPKINYEKNLSGDALFNTV